MQLNQDIKVENVFVLEVDIEKLTQLITRLQFAVQRALPGQELFATLAPGIAIRVVPQEVKGDKKVKLQSPIKESPEFTATPDWMSKVLPSKLD